MPMRGAFHFPIAGFSDGLVSSRRGRASTQALDARRRRALDTPGRRVRLSPEELRLEFPELYERKYGRPPPPAESPVAVDAFAAIRSDETLRLRALSYLRGAQVQIAMLRHELALRRKAYNPNQPRVPAGNPDGGEWTREGSRFGRVQFAQNTERITDAWGEPYYNRGGHHELPRSLYEHYNLRPETRRVFDRATTGTIPDMSFRMTPDGPRIRHAFDHLHRSYNDAAKELGDGFLQRNRITMEEMTERQARNLLKEIRQSEDPRLRDLLYNVRYSGALMVGARGMTKATSWIRTQSADGSGKFCTTE